MGWADNRGLELKLIPQMGRAIHPWKIHPLPENRRGDRRIRSRHRPHAQFQGGHSWQGRRIATTDSRRSHDPRCRLPRRQSMLARAIFRRAERWAARRCQALISVCDAMTDHTSMPESPPREVYDDLQRNGLEPFWIRRETGRK
ncbi:MAG: hypothetical protein Ct9H300mP1_00020 [Planctomycetaceae bacterium]|nr:MAG: hypothetical protein Ct9H300mP1_00020 [Planctomycetaceae bacterium]